MLEHRQLKHFIAVVDLGNFSKAAEAMNITPPALTKSIQNLEERLGVTLLDRKYGLSEPTIFGEVLIDHARSLILASADIENHIAQIANLETGRLSIGAGILATDSVLREALLNVAERFPKLEFDIHTDSLPVLQQQLHRGDIELYVGYIRETEEEGNLKVVELRRDSTFLVCGSHHPLCNRNNIQVSEITDFPVVSSPIPYEIRQNLETYLGSEYMKSVPHISTNSLYLIKKILQRSNHIAIGTARLFADELTSGDIVKLPIDENFGHTSPGIVYKQNRSLSPAAKALIAELERHGADSSS